MVWEFTVRVSSSLWEKERDSLSSKNYEVSSFSVIYFSYYFDMAALYVNASLGLKFLCFSFEPSVSQNLFRIDKNERWSYGAVAQYFQFSAFK